MGIERLLVKPNNEIAGRYRAVGSGRATATLWYGLNLQDAVIKADLEAFKEVFDDIKRQVDADADRLHLRPGAIYAPADSLQHSR